MAKETTETDKVWMGSLRSMDAAMRAKFLEELSRMRDEPRASVSGDEGGKGVEADDQESDIAFRTE
ncbi:hypothetical protein ACJ73_10303, partial [Blastomyces percursus]